MNSKEVVRDAHWSLLILDIVFALIRPTSRLWRLAEEEATVVGCVSRLSHLMYSTIFVLKQAFVSVQLYWTGRVRLRHPAKVVAL